MAYYDTSLFIRMYIKNNKRWKVSNKKALNAPVVTFIKKHRLQLVQGIVICLSHNHAAWKALPGFNPFITFTEGCFHNNII